MEDLRDALEIHVDRTVTVVVEGALPVPGARLFLRRIGQLIEVVDGGFDDLRHPNAWRRALTAHGRGALTAAAWIAAAIIVLRMLRAF